MVCLGNICRSPLAEGILKSKVNSKQIFVDSAGTQGWHAGEQPDIRSIDVARKHGIDISMQKSRKFRVQDFEDFDCIYAMDTSNYADLLSMAPNETAKAKVRLILNEIYPNENKSVPDPYYGGADGFQKVYDMLDKACDEIVAQIESSKK